MSCFWSKTKRHEFNERHSQERETWQTTTAKAATAVSGAVILGTSIAYIVVILCLSYDDEMLLLIVLVLTIFAVCKKSEKYRQNSGKL